MKKKTELHDQALINKRDNIFPWRANYRERDVGERLWMINKPRERGKRINVKSQNNFNFIVFLHCSNKNNNGQFHILWATEISILPLYIYNQLMDLNTRGNKKKQQQYLDLEKLCLSA